ncbi:site-2 protease family protein [Desulfocurvus sp. DL9XJH121]
MHDISTSVIRITIMAVPFLLAVTCHEVAHGLTSYWFGDPTAKMSGRLTLNPIKHLDPMGTLVFLITAFTGGFIIGWAKPVPIDPRYYKNTRLGVIVVSAAGAAVNFLLAALFWLGYQYIVVQPVAPGGMEAYFLEPAYLICRFGVVINVVLGVFNLLPVPPLDGSRILAELLPPNMARAYMSVERYGFIILIVLIMTGALRFVFAPVWQILAAIL